MSTEKFDLERSRNYWRFAPSGAGKHDTASLANVDDDAVFDEWKDGFAKRFSNYAEEDEFLRVMGREFAGKRVLSIGSGLGFHEIYYASRGAHISCYDIVPSNLEIIKRVSRHCGFDVDTFVLDDSSRFSDSYDAVFLYGSLMTMPEPEQSRLLAKCRAALAPTGRIVLMLYTWEFARATCGWSSPDEFDPAIFARASDPSVGDEHCPWSDWHDDKKLLAIAPSDLTIVRRQFWQQDWFVWYELGQSNAPVGAFFDTAVLKGEILTTLDLADFEASAAEIGMDGNTLRVTTGINCASYAAISSPLEAYPATSLIVDAELRQGALSIGVLDTATDKFLATHSIVKVGRTTHIFSIPAVPANARLVLSNFQPEPAASTFAIMRVDLSKRDSANAAFLEQFAH